MLRCFVVLITAVTLCAPGCGSCGSDDKKEDADEPDKTQRKKLRDPDDPKPKERPKACVQAEACCAEMAEARGQDPDLVCSGVKLVQDRRQVRGVPRRLRRRLRGVGDADARGVHQMRRRPRRRDMK